MKRWIWGFAAASVVLVVAVVAVVLAPIRASADGAGIVTVTSGAPLNVRSGPATSYPLVGTLPPGVVLRVHCQVAGELVGGDVRTTTTWNQLVDGSYVSDAYIQWAPGGQPSACSNGATANVTEFLNARDNASTANDPVTVLTPHAPLDVQCQLGGEEVTGLSGTSSIWDRLTDGSFVADAFVGWIGDPLPVPWCSLQGAPMPAAGEPFISWAATYAEATALTYHVPASFTIAQAIWESTWGTSGLAVQGNNLFGMKCFGTPGKIATGCDDFGTFECEPGCYDTSASFRMYADPKDSFVDQATQLCSLDRYAGAFAYTNDPDKFAAAVHDGGWATDPTYTDKLVATMKNNNLYRFDVPLPTGCTLPAA